MQEEREFRFDEISFWSICRSLLRNLWLAVLAAAAAWLLVTGVRNLIYVPEYTSRAVMAVNARGGQTGISSLSLTTQMADIFSQVFSSSVLKEEIAKSLGQETVDAEIEASIIEETNLIQIGVTADDPRQAYQILQSAVENYGKVSDYLFSNAVLQMVQEPNIPYGPSNSPRLGRVRMLAAAGAGAMVCAAAVLFSVLNCTVQTKNSARRNLDGRIIETIPYERKYKTLRELVAHRHKALLISSPLIGMAFSETFRKLATQLAHHMKKRGQKVLAITSLAENEGKSSVAANISLALADTGAKVLLIDTDLKKPALYRIFEYKDAQDSFSSYLQKKGKMEIVQIQGISRPISVLFQKSSIKESASLLDSEQMQALIQEAKETMDYIILDSSPVGITSDTEYLLKAADAAVLVVRQDRSDIRAINQAAESIRQSGADFIGYVLNAFRAQIGDGSSGYGYYGYGAYKKNRKGGSTHE